TRLRQQRDVRRSTAFDLGTDEGGDVITTRGVGDLGARTLREGVEHHLHLFLLGAGPAPDDLDGLALQGAFGGTTTVPVTATASGNEGDGSDSRPEASQRAAHAAPP